MSTRPLSMSWIVAENRWPASGPLSWTSEATSHRSRPAKSTWMVSWAKRAALARAMSSSWNASGTTSTCSGSGTPGTYLFPSFRPISDPLDQDRCRKLPGKVAQILDVGGEDHGVSPGGDDHHMAVDHVGGGGLGEE